MSAIVYMLKCSDNSFYVGVATGNDLTKRFKEHRVGSLRRLYVFTPSGRCSLGRSNLTASRMRLPLNSSSKDGVERKRSRSSTEIGRLSSSPQSVVAGSRLRLRRRRLRHQEQKSSTLRQHRCFEARPSAERLSMTKKAAWIFFVRRHPEAAAQRPSKDRRGEKSSHQVDNRQQRRCFEARPSPSASA